MERATNKGLAISLACFGALCVAGCGDGCNSPISPVDMTSTDMVVDMARADLSMSDLPLPDLAVPDDMTTTGDMSAPSITGTWIDLHVTDNGTVTNRAIDLTATGVSIQAIIPINSGTSTMTIDGVGLADGTFTVPGVPMVTYTLKVSRNSGIPNNYSYYVTAARHVDLGTHQLGRANRAGPTLDTRVAFSPAATGLTAFAANHQIEISAPNAGVFGYAWPDPPAPISGGTMLMDGNTSLGLELGWHLYQYGYLIDTTQMDDLWVTQLVPRTNGAGPADYLTIDKTFHVTQTITQADGVNTNIAGGGAPDFASFANNRTIALDWRRATFDGLASEINANAVFNTDSLYIYGISHADVHGEYVDSAPALFQIEFAPGPSTNANIGTVNYLNPFPSNMKEVGHAVSIFFAPYTASGAGMPSSMVGSLGYAALATAFGANPIAPVVSPPRNPTINAANATMPQTVTGTTPTLAWDAPTTGTPNAYTVNIYRVSNNGGATEISSSIGQITTTATTVKIPPDMLTVGQQYIFAVRAVVQTGVDFTTTPRRFGLPSGHADLLTALATIN